MFFAKFAKELSAGFTKDESRKRAVTMISDNNNAYKKHQLSMIPSMEVFHGVINGGAYGTQRLAVNLEKKEETEAIDRNKLVTNYHYIFCYVPSGASVGLMMVHSNSSLESITPVLRNYVSKLFSASAYNECVTEVFCPAIFQDEYRKDAVIDCVSYSTMVINQFHRKNAISWDTKEFEVTVQIKPKGGKEKKPKISEAIELIESTVGSTFGTLNKIFKLEDFKTRKIHVTDTKTKVPKVFEWHAIDGQFVSVVKLTEERVKLLEDGSPDIDALKKYCKDLFNNYVLPELNPVLKMRKV